MLVQPSCNVRFHLTWFNIDSLPHASRTTLHYIAVALQDGKVSVKQTLIKLNVHFLYFKKRLIASTKALIYFRVRYTFTSVKKKTNFHGEDLFKNE